MGSNWRLLTGVNWSRPFWMLLLPLPGIYLGRQYTPVGSKQPETPFGSWHILHCCPGEVLFLRTQYIPVGFRHPSYTPVGSRGFVLQGLQPWLPSCGGTQYIPVGSKQPYPPDSSRHGWHSCWSSYFVQHVWPCGQFLSVKHWVFGCLQNLKFIDFY